jgi:hypothetical protein
MANNAPEAMMAAILFVLTLKLVFIAARNGNKVRMTMMYLRMARFAGAQ